MFLQREIERLIDTAISEDIGSGDITTQILIDAGTLASGSFVIKQAGVVAGLPFLQTVFQKIDPELTVTLLVKEGSFQKAGTILAKVAGPARAILTGERVALNLIQHASGVATITSEYVRKLKELHCAILDTRKTLPGLRALEKYAVKVGGGNNHRYSLDDRYTIKSNHLYFLNGATKTPIKEAVKLVKASNPELLVEVEIVRSDQIDEALESGADVIMLTRMFTNEVEACVKKARKANKKIYVESQGTITLDTVRAYAETGVDGISIGSITHSVPALHIVMRLH